MAKHDPSMLHRSAALFVGNPVPTGDRICDWLTASGWRCDYASDRAMALEHAADPAVMLLIIDEHMDRETVASIVRGIRDLPDFAASLPVILCAHGDHPRAGANALLPLPLVEEQAMGVIENWTGPLDDHAFRSPDNPRYRMVRMMGQADSDRLFGLFVRSLKQGLVDLDKGGDIRQVAHNIAGIAGMMGFADLNVRWSAVSKGDIGGVEAARAETITFLNAAG